MGALVVGWVFAAMVLVFKAQLFVANAALLWLLPPILFAGISRRTRVVWLACALLLFAAGVATTRLLPSLPGLWLGGTSTIEFLALLRQWEEPTALGRFFSNFIGPTHSWLLNASFGAFYLLATVMGLWTLAWGALAALLRHKASRLIVLLPAIVTLNFLVMALGLALDQRGIGTTEELLHRPFVWAYFFVVAWIGGASVLLTRAHDARRSWPWPTTAVLICMMLAPLATDRRVQALDTMRASYLQIPTGLVEAARWLRENGLPGEVVQDSRLDPTYVVPALSDLRSFVGGTLVPTAHGTDEQRRRFGVLQALRSARDAQSLAETARLAGVDWMLLRPGERVLWPSDILNAPRYSSGGFRVYRLR
jgi:hypothetical protein